MSSFIYPNSATRKLFGQAGQALARQNKRFQSAHERLLKDARDKETGLKQAMELKLAQEKAATRRLVKRLIIGFSVAVAIIVTLFLIL